MSGMSASQGEGRLMASTIGSIVGVHSQKIQQMASEYAEKVIKRMSFCMKWVI
jgi:hypothetical protein